MFQGKHKIFNDNSIINRDSVAKMLAAAANGSQQCTGRRRTYSISGDSTASLVGGVLAYERGSPRSGAISNIQHGALAKRVPRSATGGGTTRVLYVVCFISKPGFLNKDYFVYESKLLVLLLHTLIYSPLCFFSITITRPKENKLLWNIMVELYIWLRTRYLKRRVYLKYESPQHN